MNEDNVPLRQRAALLTLPPHMRESIVRWIEHAEPHPSLMGSFLRALLTNNLRESFARADEENERAMGAWVRFLWNHAPGPCWGSENALLQWYDSHHGKTSTL